MLDVPRYTFSTLDAILCKRRCSQWRGGDAVAPYWEAISVGMHWSSLLHPASYIWQLSRMHWSSPQLQHHIQSIQIFQWIPRSSVSFRTIGFPIKFSPKPNPQSSLCVVVLPSIEVTDTWLTADQILCCAVHCGSIECITMQLNAVQSANWWKLVQYQLTSVQCIL